jgi:hypothetical protein
MLPALARLLQDPEQGAELLAARVACHIRQPRGEMYSSMRTYARSPASSVLPCAQLSSSLQTSTSGRMMEWTWLPLTSLASARHQARCPMVRDDRIGQRELPADAQIGGPATRRTLALPARLAQMTLPVTFVHATSARLPPPPSTKKAARRCASCTAYNCDRRSDCKGKDRRDRCSCAHGLVDARRRCGR